MAPTRTPTRSPSIAKTASPTRSPTIAPTTPDVPPIETASKSKGDNISVIIGASLGGAVCFLFLAYAAKMGIRHAHKEMIKQKKLDDYFKRLDVLRDNDTAAIIPMMMVPEKYKKRGGAYINSSPTNSSTHRATRHRKANGDNFATTTAPAVVPDSLPEESVASSCSNSLTGSYDISSFHTSERSSAQSVQHEKYQNSPALHPASLENLLEEGRMLNNDKNRSASSESDISAGAVSTSSYATGSSVGSEDASSGASGGDIESGSIVGSSEIGDDSNSDDISDTKVAIESGTESGAYSGEESIEISSMGSEISVDSLEEDAGFQDFMQAMSEEFFSSEASSQGDVSTEFSV
eukprot:gene20323-23087_t